MIAGSRYGATVGITPMRKRPDQPVLRDARQVLQLIDRTQDVGERAARMLRRSRSSGPVARCVQTAPRRVRFPAP